MVVVSIVAGVAVVGAAALVLTNGGSSSGNNGSHDEFTVRRGSFEITIPATGELAALKQIEIRNRLEYRAVITEIPEEGTSVKAGDVLFRLADEEIRNKIKDAEDAVNTAQSGLIAAESNLEIRISSSQSQIAQADLDVKLADLALKAWREGEVVSRRQDLALELQTAEMDYSRLHDKYEESKELVKHQYISQDEFRSDEIRMIQAEARLKQAKLDIQVYEEYEYEQQEAQKNSDVEQATAERQRVEERHKAEIETARADVTSKQHQLRSRNERLAHLQEQLGFCTVRAPSDGLVVFADSLERHRWSRGGRGDLQVGAEVRKNELVMVLPDTSEMTAEVKVNESHSGLVEEGQRAVITSDAVPDRALEGEVLSIGVLAESGGWRDPNRRDYTVKIRLTDGNDLGLKPAMRCKAEIYVGEVADALFVPLQAVLREGPTAYVYVPQGAGFSQRRVEIGRASGLHVEVTDGLQEGDVVLLRDPKPREIVARLSQEKPSDKQPADGRPEGVWAKDRPGRDRGGHAQKPDAPRRTKGST